MKTDMSTVYVFSSLLFSHCYLYGFADMGKIPFSGPSMLTIFLFGASN